MGEKELSTFPKEDKSSVEDLVQIPSGSKEEFTGEFAHIPPGMDEDEFDEEEYDNEDQEEKEFHLEDIFQIQDVILREKLLNVHRLITNIKSLKNNLTPDHMTLAIIGRDEKCSTIYSMLKTLLPEYDSFLFEIEPDQGGLTSIVISDNSNDPLLELPEFESFHFDLDPSFPRPPPEPPDVEIRLIFEPDASPVID
ncbi:hypothetical protein Tco_0227099 [Tanacetum coccineum]